MQERKEKKSRKLRIQKIETLEIRQTNDSQDNDMKQKEINDKEGPPSATNHEPHGGCQVNGPKVAKFLDR